MDHTNSPAPDVLARRRVKSAAMQFEKTNFTHLLVFASTNNFYKIAGHSVLFFTHLIAERLQYRYHLQKDSDHYFRSLDGIISIPDLPRLEARLREINLFVDKSLTTSELHYYKLPHPYSEQQIELLRQNLRRQQSTLTEIVLPKSPNPLLYTAIREINHIIYYDCRAVSDPLAKSTIVPRLVSQANQLLTHYFNHANRHPANLPTHLTLEAILLANHRLRASIAEIQALHLFPLEHVVILLEHIVTIERLTKREHQKALKELEHPAKSPNVKTILDQFHAQSKF